MRLPSHQIALHDGSGQLDRAPLARNDPFRQGLTSGRFSEGMAEGHKYGRICAPRLSEGQATSSFGHLKQKFGDLGQQEEEDGGDRGG